MNFWQADSPLVRERLKNLFENIELHSDFTFTILEDNCNIPVHKIIISAASPVLERIAYGSQQFQSNATAEVDGISSTAFREILRYIYTEKLNLTDDNIIQILHKSNYYGLSHLEKECKAYLADKIGKDVIGLNVCWIYHQLFREIYSTDLVKACVAKIKSMPINFFRNEEFLKCSVDEIKEILKLDEIKFTEIQFFRYIIKWAKVNCENSGKEGTDQNLKEILDGADQLIRFTTMKMDHFDECVSTVPNFWTTAEIEDIKMSIRNGTPKEHARFFLFKDAVWKRLLPSQNHFPPDAFSAVGGLSSRHGIFIGRQTRKGISEACLTDDSAFSMMNNQFEHFRKSNLHILCGNGYKWIAYNASEGIPLGAVQTDRAKESPVLIGRVYRGNNLYVGPIYCIKDQIIMIVNISHDYLKPIRRQITSQFDILVLESLSEFYFEHQALVPTDSVFIGNNENNEPLYLGMGFHGQKLVPASIFPQMNVGLTIPLEDRVLPIKIKKGSYAYLQMHPASISWERVNFDDLMMPTNAVVAGFGPYGEKLYYGRSVYDSTIVGGIIVPSEKRIRYIYNNQVNTNAVYDVLVKIALE